MLMIVWKCHLDTASVSVIIPESTTAAPTTTTDRHVTFWMDPRNVAWVTVAVLLFTGLSLFCAFLIVRYGNLPCLQDSFKPKYLIFLNDWKFVVNWLVSFCGVCFAYSMFNTLHCILYSKVRANKRPTHRRAGIRREYTLCIDCTYLSHDVLNYIDYIYLPCESYPNNMII